MERMFHMLLYRTFHAQRSCLRPAVEELGLGTGQPKLLRFLSSHGPCRPKEIADYFEIDPAAVSRMLDVLEKGGFVTREPDETCRRSDRIELTERGRNAQQEWKLYCEKEEEKMLAGFSEEEIALFSDFLKRAYQNLRAAEQEEPLCKT